MSLVTIFVIHNAIGHWTRSLWWLIYSDSTQLDHRRYHPWNWKWTKRSPCQDWSQKAEIVTLKSRFVLCSVDLWNRWSHRDFSFRISYSGEWIRSPILDSFDDFYCGRAYTWLNINQCYSNDKDSCEGCADIDLPGLHCRSFNDAESTSNWKSILQLS